MLTILARGGLEWKREEGLDILVVVGGFLISEWGRIMICILY